MGKLVMVYTPGLPDEKIETIDGKVPYGEYLVAQKKRLEKRPDRVVKIIAKRKDSSDPIKVSLWANDRTGG